MSQSLDYFVIVVSVYYQEYRKQNEMFDNRAFTVFTVLQNSLIIAACPRARISNLSEHLLVSQNP